VGILFVLAVGGSTSEPFPYILAIRGWSCRKASRWTPFLCPGHRNLAL